MKGFDCGMAVELTAEDEGGGPRETANMVGKIQKEADLPPIVEPLPMLEMG